MIMKKIVVRTGRNRLPSFLPSVSNTIVLRTKSEHVLERGLTAGRDQLHAAGAEPEPEDEREDHEQADQHDPVELERRPDEQEAWRERIRRSKGRTNPPSDSSAMTSDSAGRSIAVIRRFSGVGRPRRGDQGERVPSA